MEVSETTASLSALSQLTRYRCFELLVQRGATSAGDLAALLEVPANLMSSHLSILSAAGLVHSERAGRSIVYSADKAALAKLIAHLVALAAS